MKKILALLLCVLLCAALFAGCGNKNGENGGAASPAGKLNVVVTTFPLYDWLRNLAGDLAQITLLQDSGADLHNYNPSPDDILAVSGCDLFIYVGGESDKWVEDVLSQAANENLTALNLMETLGDRVKEEETRPGMQAEEEEEEKEAYDEHIWLSLKNAAYLCGAISGTLQKADAANAEAYRANAESYIGKLEALDAEYQAAVDAANVKTLLFGDRFPFLYLVKDYGLDYYAAFRGCSAESEASFETVMFLAQQADELGLRYVLKLEGNDDRIAKTVVSSTKTKDQTILSLDSMQNIASADGADGADYLAIMEKNLEVLKTAMS